jgi:hypothetical protein
MTNTPRTESQHASGLRTTVAESPPATRRRSVKVALLFCLGWLLMMPSVGGAQESQRTGAALDLARIRPGVRSYMGHAGWASDTEPFLERLLAGREMEILNARGPGVVTHLRVTHDRLCTEKWAKGNKTEAARGVMLLIHYDGHPTPAVQVPLGDFFCDGDGTAVNFSSHFVEKAVGDCYNAWIQMPFRKSVRIALRNDLSQDLRCYAVAEWESLPSWDSSLGCFHATWRRQSFQLDATKPVDVFHVDGEGHLIGRHWQVATDEPAFTLFSHVMEGNNEVRIDGQEPVGPGPYVRGQTPSYNYLGSEDSFGFSWGWGAGRTQAGIPAEFTGLWHGINLAQQSRDVPLKRLSVYRFRGRDPIRFSRSLDWKLNWSCEPGRPALTAKLIKAGGAWVDYATTHYWYQSKVGYLHAEPGPVAKRSALLLHGDRVVVGADGSRQAVERPKQDPKTSQPRKEKP